MYYIYIDVVFFVNLIMDLVVLNLVRIILKMRTSVLRMIAAGIMGALWGSFLAVCPVFPAGVQMALTYGAVSGLMVKTAFHTKGAAELIKGVLGMYLAAAALGGSMFALYQHTRIGYYVEQLIRGSYVEGMPFIILVLLTAGAVFGLKYLWLNVTEVRRQKSNLYEVTLLCGDKRLSATGLLDTGNQLYEPVSRKPVHVVSEWVWQQMHTGEEPVLLIPFHTIGTEEGWMTGMVIDSMVIWEKEKERIVMRPLIAVSPKPLCRDKSYEILLHGEQDETRRNYKW